MDHMGVIMYMREDLKYAPLLIHRFQDRFRKMKRRILFILFLCNYWLSFSYCGFRKVPQNVSVILGEEITLQCAYESRGTSIVELWESIFKEPVKSSLFRDSQWRSSAGNLLGIHDSGRLPGHQGRYSYVKDSPEELDLVRMLKSFIQTSRHFQKISDVRLDDDGEFECQMLNPDEGPIRAAAHLNVIGRAQTIEWRDEIIESTRSSTCIRQINSSSLPFPFYKGIISSAKADHAGIRPIVYTLHRLQRNEQVSVPPTIVYFENYQTNRSIEVFEGTELNVTCVAPNTKPKAQIYWYQEHVISFREAIWNI